MNPVNCELVTTGLCRTPTCAVTETQIEKRNRGFMPILTGFEAVLGRSRAGYKSSSHDCNAPILRHSPRLDAANARLFGHCLKKIMDLPTHAEIGCRKGSKKMGYFFRRGQTCPKTAENEGFIPNSEDERCALRW